MGRRFREHWQLLGLVALFIVSRALLASTTGKLSMDPLTFYWQYADPKLLREDLLRTIFYLHSQPPLYNLYLGLGLKLFPKNYSAAFAACQYLISLGFSVALFELMRRLTVPKTLAFLLAAAFILSPPYLSYEHWLFYDFGAAALLCGTALFFSWHVATGRLAAAFATVALAATLALAVAGFHYLWVLAIVIALCLLRREKWKKIVIASALPVALVLGVHLKNLIVFGHFSVDTYFVAGNLALISVNRIPLPLRRQLAAQGKISDFAVAPPFEQYTGPRPLPSRNPTGIAVLDTETKSSGGVNLHSKMYLDMSDRLVRNAFFVVRNYPEYVAPIARKLASWLSLPSNESWGIPRYAKLERIARAFPFAVFGPSSSQRVLPIVLLLPLGYALLIVLCGRHKKSAKPFTAGCGYLAATILGFNVPLILFTWEVHRYRFRTDALSLALLAVLLAHVYRAVMWRWRAFAPVARARQALAAFPYGGEPDPRVQPNATVPVPTVTAHIHALVEHASQNGDLLLHVGPRRFAAPPEPDPQVLRGVRHWLDVNGEAIYGTRPWVRAQATTTEGGRVRFTATDQALYLILLDPPSGLDLTIDDLSAEQDSRVVLLGDEQAAIVIAQEGRRLTIRIAHPVDRDHASVFKITPVPARA